MSEKMPSFEDVTRNPQQYMDKKQIEKSEEREQTFMAGEDAGRSEMGKLFTSSEIGYDENGSILWPKKGATEDQIIKFIKAIPTLDKYDVCGAKILSENVIKTIVEKFPNAVFTDINSLRTENDFWVNKIREMGGKTDQDEYWDDLEKNQK